VAIKLGLFLQHNHLIQFVYYIL